MTRRSTALLAAATTAVLMGGAQAALGAPGTSSSGASNSKTERVIVVLRDQLHATPANAKHIQSRASAASRDQSAVLGRLSGRAATHVAHFAVGNAFAATVTVAQAAALAADPAVASVVKDSKIAATPARAAAPAGSGKTTKVKPLATPTQDQFAVCPTDPAQPLVEPEALNTLHARSTDGSPDAQSLDKGKGVVVAYIADGIDPDNPNFIRPDGKHAIIDYKDFSGDGPDAPSGGGEAFGDASAIAAQGTVAYDLSNFVNSSYPLPAGCNIRILGVAPDASIVALKAGGEFLTNSSILQSIDYAVRVDHVDVINESFGLNQFPDDSSRSTVQLFNDQAVAAGVTVTTSTGDGGVTNTIGSDAQDPLVISAGATTDSQLYAQTGYAGARAFGNGKWANNEISALSSAGITQLGRTLDVVAPGEADWASCEPGFASCTNFNGGAADIEAFGGTSQSAPLTAGVAALVISEYRKTHGGASPTPAVVKQIITGTATDLGFPAFEQGSGLVNARAAVEAAATWPGAASAPGSLKSNIVTSPNQIKLTGLPGQTKSGTFKVTNVGTSSLQVAAGTRVFQTIAESAQATSFNSGTQPTFPYPTNGAPWAYKKLTFSVPSGAQRLVTHMAWAGSQPPAADAIMRVSLFAPDGTYVANSRPQGGAATANYANVDVRNPASGTWTAVLYSAAGSAGYTGVVGFDAQSQRAIPEGSISPANATIAAGASKTFTFTDRLPSKAAGDHDVAITLATSAGRTTSVSAIVRTLIDVAHGGAFTGAVTGGNARAVTPGQTFTYGFDVPANQSDLDVSLKFHHNPESIVDMVLIDPNGELADVVTNLTPNVSGTQVHIAKNIQALDAKPLAGRWLLVVVVQNPVSGTAFTEPFQGTVTFNGVGASAPDLPNDTGTTLPAGQPVTVAVAVTNPGSQAILVGADPRLKHLTTQQPVPIQGSTTFALPPDPSQEPIYVVPPDTKSLTVSASSTTPAQLELQGSAAGFDLFGDLAAAQSGNTLSVASVSEPGPGFISKGIWFTNMQEIGPFTDDGQTAGSTTITASMQSYAFDSAVTSSTGDPFGNAVDPTNNGFGHPVKILPGQTKTITLTITPSGKAGKVISGVLNLVTVPSFPAGFTALPQLTTGSVIRTLPYSYTIG